MRWLDITNMSPRFIRVGKTYRNNGKGQTTRTVLAIGDEHRPSYWFGNRDSATPNEPGVKYKQGDKERTLYLSSFAQWAGSEV